jgi:large subunit ribosomal protein L1
MAKKAQAEKAALAEAPAATPEPTEGAPAKAKEPRKPREPKAKTAPAARPPAAAEAATPATSPEAPAAAPAPGAAPAEPAKKKGKRPGTSPRLGKKLRNLIREQQQRIVKEGPAPVKKAVSLLKKMKRIKFDETVEVHMCLGVDMTQSDQMVRGSVSLPHGIGKSVRLLVFCQGDNVAKAKQAGADYAGSDEFIK